MAGGTVGGALRGRRRWRRKARRPPPSAPPPARPPAGAPNDDNDEKAEPPKAADERPEVEDDEFIPTEELQPDAAVTFPVDI